MVTLTHRGVSCVKAAGGGGGGSKITQYFVYFYFYQAYVYFMGVVLYKVDGLVLYAPPPGDKFFQPQYTIFFHWFCFVTYSLPALEPLGDN